MNFIKKYQFICPVIWLLLCFNQITAQTGGTFEIKQSVIAGGGAQQSTGGNFSLDGTIGQSLAGGFFQNARYSVYNGFWTPETFAPTAANVSIYGRVRTASGRGIVRIRISLTNASGETRSAQTTNFGYFRFDNLPAGEIYILTARGKRFTFSNPTQVINLTEETEINFTANR